MSALTAHAWPNVLLLAALALIAMSAAVALFSHRLERAARRRQIESLAQVVADVRPSLIVALGCPPRARDGRPSAYLAGRARAAAAVFHALGSGPILCSGRVEPPLEGESEGSDEAEALAALLESAGVPREAIRFDRGALRTIDTIEHLSRHHRDERLLIVTQAFHLPRALFLARAHRLEAWGMPAPGPPPGLRARMREVLGRIRAAWDVAFDRRGR